MQQDTLVTIEGIPFNAEDVTSSDQKSFVDRTQKQYWQSVPAKQREEMLKTVYKQCKAALAEKAKPEEETPAT